MKRQEYNHKEINGVDADIETSLKEYGLAWVETDKDILFYYGIGYGPNEEGFEEYVKFDFCTIDKNTDIKNEYDWADFDAVSNFIGTDIFTLPLIQQIESLNSYYGYENVFGSSYWEGLNYEEIVNILYHKTNKIRS